MLRTFLAAALALLFLAPSALAAGSAAPPPTPAGAAQSFYTFHLGHDMGFSREGIARRAEWLSPGLLDLCEKYLARPSSPDEVPSVDGDPFTDSQEYPDAFTVGKVRMSNGKATVDVSFSGPGPNRGKVHLVLTQGKGAWLIDDVRYASGPSFRKLLAP